MHDKRVVVITGSSSGIGLATSHLFSENGWHTVGIDIKRPAPAMKVCRFICADLACLKYIDKAVADIASNEGRIDALVNNAGFQLCKGILETSALQWDNIFAVNVKAPFLLVKKCYPMLKKAKGAVVNVASVHAFASSKKIAAYAATKGALLTLTRNMAVEFLEDSVRVNAVAPGAVDTAMLKAGLKRLDKKRLLGRVAAPEEIAKVIYFLSDNGQSSFITGETLIADGGALAKLSTE